MIQQRYTARIRLEKKVVLIIPGDDVNKLLAKLLGQLDGECSNALGEIIENKSGEVVHQCRKQPFE